MPAPSTMTSVRANPASAFVAVRPCWSRCRSETTGATWPGGRPFDGDACFYVWIFFARIKTGPCGAEARNDGAPMPAYTVTLCVEAGVTNCDCICDNWLSRLPFALEAPPLPEPPA